MNKKVSYTNYYACIHGILRDAFKDKTICLNFLFALVFLCIGVLANVSIPLLLKKIVEIFSSTNNLSFSLLLLSYGFIWMASQVSVHLRSILAYKIEQRITYVLGIRVLSHLYTLSHRYFLSQKPGELTNIIRRAQQHVPSLVLGIFFHVLPTIIEFFLAIILISYFYPYTYSFLIVGVFTTFVLYTSFSMRTVLKARELANNVDKNVDGVVTDWISNYEAIKVFGKSHLATNICERELKKREIAEVTFMTKLGLTHLGQSLILGIGLAFLTYLVGQGVLKGSLTTGDFVLFNGYVLQFVIPMNILGQITQEIKKSLVDMKGIMDLLLIKDEIKEADHPLSLSGSHFQIDFENVFFKYEDRYILEDISFTVETGETAFVLGPSGVGKSTLAKLLLRLYDPIKGRILINHVDIKQFSLQSLHEMMGWVPQEGYLLNDTIKNNVNFVKPEASSRDIEKALEQADLFNFIRELPQGIDTVIGDRGLKLSGGEKQRLSLARLFLKKPKICIFDESTASLDKGTAITIQHNILTHLKDSTKIIITHRPFIINNCYKTIDISQKYSSSSSCKKETRNV